MKTFYTYHIIDPETNKVFYVGKGCGQRIYIHMTRALKWKQTGKIVSGGNKHLYHKLLKINDKGLSPIYQKVLETGNEKDAFEREELDIKKFGLENLCNLTYGGEGETKTPETIEKMKIGIAIFWNSEDGYAMRKEFSDAKMGSKNPRWGIIENEEHKKLRMASMLSKPRWNVGLKGDPRSKGPPKGNIPHNILPCRLINKDGKIIEACSMKELSILSGVSITTINRLRHNIYKQNKKGWRFELIEKDKLIIIETDQNDKK